MTEAVDAVTVWKVKDGEFRVYLDGKFVTSIPLREFPNVCVEMCKELTRQSIKTAAR